MKLCTFVDAGNANLMGVAPLTGAHCLLIDISVMRDTNDIYWLLSALVLVSVPARTEPKDTFKVIEVFEQSFALKTSEHLSSWAEKGPVLHSLITKRAFMDRVYPLVEQGKLQDLILDSPVRFGNRFDSWESLL